MGRALAVCSGILPLSQYRAVERGHRELGSAPVRATAMSINLFCIHFFGDTFSPQIIGAISDRSNLSIGLGATLVSSSQARFCLWAHASRRFWKKAREHGGSWSLQDPE